MMKNKKRVLILSVHFGRKGGVTNYVDLLIQNLSKEEFQVRHFATGKDPVKWKNIFIPFLFIYQLLRTWFIIKEFKPDIVHINPSLNSTAIIRDSILLLIAKKANVPVLFFVRGWKKYISKYFFGYGVISKFFRWIFSMPDMIVVLASEFKEELVKLGVDTGKIKLSKTMVESEKYQNEERVFKRPFRVLFSSRIEKYKGVYELLKAVPLVHKKYPQTKFIFMGNGSELKNLKRKINKSNLSDVVDCIGFRNGDEKIKVFLENDIFVLPSYSEGFPNVYCEALAAGLPIITTYVGGLRDVFLDGRQGFIIQSIPPDPDEIAEKIIELFRNPGLMKKISRDNSKEAIEKYDVKIVSKEIEKIYEQMTETIVL